MLRISNVVMLFTVAAFGASTARADVSPEQALAKAWKVVRASTTNGAVKYKAQITAHWGVPVRLKGPENDPYAEIERGPEGLCYSFYFDDGSSGNIIVDINIKTGKLHYFSQMTHTEGNRGDVMTVGACRQKAVAWFKAVGESLAPDMEIYSSRPAGKYGDATMHSFEWRKAIKVKAATVMAPPSVSVEVNTRTGEIAWFFLRDFQWQLPSLEPQASRGQAIEMAKKLIREDAFNPYGKEYRGGEPTKLTDVFLVVRDSPAYKNSPARAELLWEIRFDGKMKGRGRNGPVWSEVHWTALVHTINGQPAESTHTTGPYIQPDDRPADERRKK